ncbi:peptidoglycan-binding domain-containing protein [Kitasatospora cineracea]|uniref:peptidoglycan-binding domain-containing protein n=1 Tax=Kitasatospora cineracea TaxID=88074 RepID=UPI0036A080C5
MRDEFVGQLLAEVGQHEGRDRDGTWNNRQRYSTETPGLEWSDGQPWCATFEAWAAHRTGMDALWPMTASCWSAVQWWQAHGRWSQYPVLGGPFYLGPGGSSHTGVVYAYDADRIWTVEGNTSSDGSTSVGDGVYLRERPRRGSGSPYGYGVPAFPEGTVSADPALGGTPAARVGAQAPAPAPQPAAPAPLPPLQRAITRVLINYCEGADAREWQRYMHDVRGWRALVVDGKYGPKSAEICRQFQADSTANGWPLVVDGKAGPKTIDAMLHRPISR